MGLIFRAQKGSALTHTELDNNFREAFVSASVEGTDLSLFTSAALNNEYVLPMPAPNGFDYHIQFKKGNEISGSEVSFSSSADFKYDFRTSHLKNTGSFTNLGDATVDGNLVVTGVLTAQELRTEFNNASVVFDSGSTKFGNSADDKHSFTGSLVVVGSITGSDATIDTWGSISGSLASNLTTTIAYSASIASALDTEITALSSSAASALTTTSGSISTDVTALSSSLALRISNGDTAVNNNVTALSSSASTARDLVTTTVTDRMYANFLRNITDTLDGDLTVTGTINAQEINTTYISSSILYNSGSNIFGDAASDKHIFTGSLDISNDLTSRDLTAIGALYIPNVGNVETKFDAIDSTLAGLSTDYPDLTNIPSGIISSSAFHTPSQGTLGVTYNGTLVGNQTFGLGISNSPTFADLTLNGFTSVSSSLAALTAGTITIGNDVDNRVLTANGNSTLNGEGNLTFDGTNLIIGGSQISDYTSAKTDVTGLTGGTTNGTLIQGKELGHLVLGIRGNDTDDTFSILSGDGDFYSNSTYDKLAFQVKANGTTIIGGGTTINGNLLVTGDVTAYHSSDKRLKDNISPIPWAVDKVKALGGYSFDWNDKSEHEGHDIGVIAQEVEEVLPELVVTREDGYKAVSYEKIVALLIEAIKDQQLQIDALKSNQR
jgi:hypothetical protein|tara:strand:+ start:18395 stop:20389 length:1995 start_codon:yes stop_codon:yes gene_type:complete